MTYRDKTLIAKYQNMHPIEENLTKTVRDLFTFPRPHKEKSQTEAPTSLKPFII